MSKISSNYLSSSQIPNFIIQMQQNTMNPQFPENEHLNCPRCDSGNTKFCYYNNYNLLQPRHYCKNCRRYWTKGGTLRNIPVGGGIRKSTKRGSNSSSNSNKRSLNSSNHDSPETIASPPPPSAQSKAEPSVSLSYHHNDKAESDRRSFGFNSRIQIGGLADDLRPISNKLAVNSSNQTSPATIQPPQPSPPPRAAESSVSLRRSFDFNSRIQIGGLVNDLRPNSNKRAVNSSDQTSPATIQPPPLSPPPRAADPSMSFNYSNDKPEMNYRSLDFSSRMEIGGLVDDLRPNLNKRAVNFSNSNSTVTISPPPPSPPPRAQSLSFNYSNDQPEMNHKSFNFNSRVQIGGLVDNSRPNLNNRTVNSSSPTSPVIIPPQPLPVEHSVSFNYSNDNPEMNHRSFNFNSRMQFEGLVKNLRPNSSGGSEETGLIGAPATGVYRNKFLNLNNNNNNNNKNDDQIGRDESSLWNLSIFTPGSNLQ